MPTLTLEYSTDAGKVNTDTGWRDVNVAVFCTRPVGPPASLADREGRASRRRARSAGGCGRRRTAYG